MQKRAYELEQGLAPDPKEMDVGADDGDDDDGAGGGKGSGAGAGAGGATGVAPGHNLLGGAEAALAALPPTATALDKVRSRALLFLHGPQTAACARQ